MFYLLTKHMRIGTHGQFHFQTIQTLTNALKIRNMFITNSNRLHEYKK